MPRVRDKLYARAAECATLEAKKITDLYEEQLAGAIGGVSLIKDRWGRHGLIKRQITEPVVVTDIDRGSWVQKVGHQNISSELFCRRKWSTRVTSEIGLQIQQLIVSECGVVIENYAKGQLFCELVIEFGAKQIIVEDRLSRRETVRS
jgi:hypothetical protein